MPHQLQYSLDGSAVCDYFQGVMPSILARGVHTDREAAGTRGKT